MAVVVVAVVDQAIVRATAAATLPIDGTLAVVADIVDIAVDTVAADIVAADTVAVGTIADCRTHSIGHRLHSAAANRNCHQNSVHRSVLNRYCLIWRMCMPQ